MTPLDRWRAALHGEGLTPTEKLVLLYVAYKDGGDGCYKSVRNISAVLEVNRRTVQRCLSSLVDKGWLVRSRVSANRTTRTYIFRPIGWRSHAAPLRSHAAPPAVSRRPEHDVEREGIDSVEYDDDFLNDYLEGD